MSVVRRARRTQNCSPFGSVAAPIRSAAALIRGTICMQRPIRSQKPRGVLAERMQAFLAALLSPMPRRGQVWVCCVRAALAERLLAFLAMRLSLVPGRARAELAETMPAAHAGLLSRVPSPFRPQWVGRRLLAFLAMRPPHPQQRTRQQQHYTVRGYHAVTYNEADVRQARHDRCR